MNEAVMQMESSLRELHAFANERKMRREAEELERVMEIFKAEVADKLGKRDG